MRKGLTEARSSAVKSGAVKIAYDKGAVNWDPSNAQKEADAMLVAHPNIKAVLAGNDQLADGVIQALKRVGKAGKVDVIGLDEEPIGAQNILLGNQKATVIKSFDIEMGNACTAIITQLEKKPLPKSVFNATWSFKTAPVPFRDVAVEVVERNGLAKGIAGGSLTKAEMCKGLPKGAGKPYC